eukprot:7106345-Alexandrium_andersonii.AAC.1
MANAVISTPAPTQAQVAEVQTLTPAEAVVGGRLDHHIKNMAMVSRAHRSMRAPSPATVTRERAARAI